MSRLQQINSTLQKNIGLIMSEKIESPFDFLATITHVDCSPDMKEAKVLVSVLPFAKAEDALRFLNGQKREIQRLLGQTLKMQFTPRISFLIDDTEEFAHKIYHEIDNLDIE
ncbi:MAG: 30S ribosome-binding factor RbfA [Patescibacteria group bacterium]